MKKYLILICLSFHFICLLAQEFKPTWQSLEDNYKCPEWFRDAKFGIWAHWGPQCVPEYGDWYARGMYLQGSGDYNHHVNTYGHPSQFGFMELINLYKAEKWDPEKLMDLYVKAGAKYFVSMANHHDNFDNYNSKYHEWNSVNVGPKKDIVGVWEKVARKHGLRFGVSNHSSHAWHWYQTAYGYDAEGDKKQIRYDACNLTKADGKGKWWEGLDPQVLYTGRNILMSDSIKSIKELQNWHEKYSRPWVEDAPGMNPQFVRNWFLRCQDLIDSYKPDFVYFDNFGLPFGQTGLDIAAYYYNANKKWNNGKLDAVLTAKELQPGQEKGIIEDYERSSSDKILDDPWQTCTCIGQWHYAKNQRYKSARLVINMLVDIVSKNGNLLLSIPMRADGTIDENEIKFLKEMEQWMAINSEGIFGTRPWKISGEGPTRIGKGMFTENSSNNLSGKDIRFTQKGKKLYAFVLGKPEKSEINIKALASNSIYCGNKKIKSIKMLGSGTKIVWQQTKNDVTIKLPINVEDIAFAFEIEGLTN